jgi:hypothetical protein
MDLVWLKNTVTSKEISMDADYTLSNRGWSNHIILADHRVTIQA